MQVTRVAPNRPRHMKNTRMPTPVNAIWDAIIAEVQERLAQGKRIRRNLPANGRLHIDRPLPFLVAYRQPPERTDKGTALLVKGEASYLIASGKAKQRPGLSRLVRTVVRGLAERHSAVLIVEVWSGSGPAENGGSDPRPSKPAFVVHISGSRPPTRAAEGLEEELKRIVVSKRSADVQLVSDDQPSPADMGPLISERDAREFNCYLVGLEIAPTYQHPATGETFPLVLRRLHLGLSRALKKAAFEFALDRTELRPVHYQALGRRVAVKAVWLVDSRLADISNRFDFLLLVTPVNVDTAWGAFKRRKFEQEPTFFYRPRPVDPATLKKALYNIPIGRVEDPTLALLFRQKRTEMDRKLTMLADRDTRRFRYGSYQLYGTVGDALMQTATELLRVIPPHSREGPGGREVNAEAFAERARREIDAYQQLHPAMAAKVLVREDVVGLLVSRGNLLVGRNLEVPASRVEALIQHEVGTHILTHYNGLAQPFKQLYCGLAGYEELQEGLAVLAEYLVGGLSRPRLRLLAGRVVAAGSLTDNATFIDTYRLLNSVHGFAERTAFVITARIYRSGGLTKDAVYLQGLMQLLQYLKEGGELNWLYAGKIAASHVPVIRELRLRRILQPVPLEPRFLSDTGATERLRLLRDGLSVVDLVKRRPK